MDDGAWNELKVRNGHLFLKEGGDEADVLGVDESDVKTQKRAWPLYNVLI